MLVHVIRVPYIEGGARVVVHDGGYDCAIFMLEEAITREAAAALAEALNLSWIVLLSCGITPNHLSQLLHAV
jgi:hypothetical protein